MANFLDDYAPVEDRLREFWSDHPDGRVMTTLIDHSNGSYIVRAEVFTGDGLDWPTASGLAHDSEDQLPANMKASALEVCETSAIGRALANLGYAAKGKRPSREETMKASPAAGPAVATAGAATTEERPRTPPQAGAPTSADGEVAGEGPGEGQPKPSPGSTIYPLRPEDCNHRAASGRWLPTKQSEGVPICPRCGLSAVIYKESA